MDSRGKHGHEAQEDCETGSEGSSLPYDDDVMQARYERFHGFMAGSGCMFTKEYSELSDESYESDISENAIQEFMKTSKSLDKSDSDENSNFNTKSILKTRVLSSVRSTVSLKSFQLKAVNVRVNAMEKAALFPETSSKLPGPHSTMAVPKRNFQKHMLLDRSKHKFPCRVKNCFKVYSTHSNLKTHMLSHTDPNRLYKCHICSMKYFSSSSLQVHLKISHSLQAGLQASRRDRVVCDFCMTSFRKKGNLMQHMKRSHFDMSRPHKCEVCQMRLASIRRFKEHFPRRYPKTSLPHHIVEQIEEAKEEAFSCPVCYKKFSDRRNQQRHLIYHSDERRKFVCEICHMRYISLANLKTHNTKHHPEEKFLSYDTEVNFSCSDCPRKFKSTGDLETHAALHNDCNSEKFECTFCYMLYPVQGALTNHINKCHQQSSPSSLKNRD